MQIIWFKRDLRLVGHKPLENALLAKEQDGGIVYLYVHEPSRLTAADSAAQHVAFVQECLADLKAALQERGADLWVAVGEVEDVFEELKQTYPGWTVLRSYRETTQQADFRRDQAVARWCRRRGVRWEETPQNGVGRAHEPKLNYGLHVQNMLSQPLFIPPANLSSCWAGRPQKEQPDLSPWVDFKEDKPLRLKGGRKQALSRMSAFFQKDKLLAYRPSISSPLTAETGCSRLSADLAYGTVSDQEVLHHLHAFLQEHGDSVELKEAGRFYVERLYWRSAYLQAFESNIQSESIEDLPDFRGVREEEFIEDWLAAWKEGRTGFPMVDAGMRMLKETGWVNMRLRGTLASFALMDLWLPRKEVGLHLAREFLDYEPAIHWGQCQIHAGTSRLSGPLSYNPTKQAQDHDPKGQFIQKWIPELRGLPAAFAHEPWKLPTGQKRPSYPAPLVPWPAAHEAARERVEALRTGTPVPTRLYWKQRQEWIVQRRQSSLF